MSTVSLTRTKLKVDCPDSDGQPMADNTVQFRRIQTRQGGLDALFLAEEDERQRQRNDRLTAQLRALGLEPQA